MTSREHQEHRRRSKSKSSIDNNHKAVDLWQVLDSILHRDMDEKRQENDNDRTKTHEHARYLKYLTLSDDRPSSASSYTLVVGAPKSGKSTLIQKFLNPTKDDPRVKPTAGLDYTFARKSVHDVKKVAHVWELATTVHHQAMMAIPWTVPRIRHARLVLVLDLASPGDAVSTVVSWLAHARAVITRRMLNVPNQVHVPVLYQDKSPDERQQLELLPIPVLLVCTKYDAFCHEDSMKRKVVAQAIRYIAHVHGASVQSCSTRDKTSLTRVRGAMNHMVFGPSKGKLPKDTATVVDSAPGLSIDIPGQDSLEDIGIPRGVKRSEFEHETLERRLEHWIHAVTEYYPLEDCASGTADHGKEEDDIPFPEAMVDAVRHQKREELLQYQKEVARKQKLLMVK